MPASGRPLARRSARRRPCAEVGVAPGGGCSAFCSLLRAVGPAPLYCCTVASTCVLRFLAADAYWGVPPSPLHQHAKHYATPGARLRGELPRPSSHVGVQVIMYVHVYVRSHMHLRISIRTYTRTDVVRYICVRAHVRTCACIPVCSCVCTYQCT